jgi:DNA polymerase
VKLSKKYEWVEHEIGQRLTVKFDNKAYRTFASLDDTDGRLMACRMTSKGLEKKKFGGTADKCFIFNDDLNGVPIPSKLDYQWYINLARKRLGDFGID